MSFIQRELDRIAIALNKQTAGDEYERLYAAQQALSWALEPGGFKSPYAEIMGIQEGSEDYSVDPHPPQSSDIPDQMHFSG